MVRARVQKVSRKQFNPILGPLPEGTLQCAECGLLIKKINLRRHSRLHSSPPNFPCTTCNRTFKQEGNLKRHMAIHSFKRTRCPICDKSYKRRDAVPVHMKNFHQTHSCQVCHRAFDNAYAFAQHCKIHSDERPYLCAECGKTFALKRYLKAHKDQTHSSRSLYSCPVCNRYIKHRTYFGTHLMRHASSLKDSCIKCLSYFNQKAFGAEFKLHVLTAHNSKVKKVVVAGTC